MGDPSVFFLALFQIAFWLVLLYLAWTWVADRLFAGHPWVRRIVRRTARLILVDPFRLSYRAVRWLVVSFVEAAPDYRLHSVYLEDFPVTPLQFYAIIEEAFAARQIIGAEVLRVARLEWHLLSARRIYLLIRFRDAVCFISGSPLGTGFLVSWRYTAMPGRLLLVLFRVPFAGVLAEKLLRPPTFYRADVYRGFEEAVRATVLEAMDLLTGQGLRPLAENEVRPLLREFYGN